MLPQKAYKATRVYHSDRKAFRQLQVDKSIERAKPDDARYRFGISIFWLPLGATRAALAWVLLTILVK
ncbi:MAG: hypothetical protein JO151_19900 [Verrucomicrobia bacterium]|nr:hypothetical protein [Verrucomicrobiota bacterium]